MFIVDYIYEFFHLLIKILKVNIPFRNKVIITVTIVVVIVTLLFICFRQ
jgi:hypothetical protein